MPLVGRLNLDPLSFRQREILRAPLFANGRGDPSDHSSIVPMASGVFDDSQDPSSSSFGRMLATIVVRKRIMSAHLR
jgi:hypothetical protein